MEALTPGVPPRALRRRAAPALAALVCLAHFGSFDIAMQPLVHDTRYYMYFASRVAHGAVPHRDFFENKTPLSIFAGALFHRLALAAGLQPIHVVRAGSLLTAAAAALLVFALFRRLAGGPLPGLLALLLHTGFPLLGALPAVGVLPKLLMALLATAVALLVRARRYALAGAAGVLAFLDWQVGGLALAGAALAALLERDGRGRALARLCLGAALTAAAAAGWLLAVGALDEAVGQTIGTLLERGAQSARRDPGRRLAHLLETVQVGCSGHEWLFWAGIAGMLVFPLWLRRSRRGRRRPALAALGVYHFGVVGFSLFDYQSYGDLFILIHSVGFFGAVLVVEGYRRAAAALAPARRHRTLLALAALALALAAFRPGPLRPRFVLPALTADPWTTLADQREVAARLGAAAAGRRMAVVGPAELLYLREEANGIPSVYWNSATYGYYRRRPDAPYLKPLEQLLARHGVEVYVADRTVPPEPGDVCLMSASGAYWVILRPVQAIGRP